MRYVIFFCFHWRIASFYNENKYKYMISYRIFLPTAPSLRIWCQARTVEKIQITIQIIILQMSPHVRARMSFTFILVASRPPKI